MHRKPLALALALPLAAAGCSWFAPEEEDLDFAEYEQQLTETYNESMRLSAELDAAEARIAQACLEAQGFTVHDPWEFREEPTGERETFLDTPPYDWFLPSAEDAARRGFWQWTTLAAPETVEDGDALLAEWDAFQAEMGWYSVDFGEDEQEEYPFFDLSEEERYAWYVAYGGEAWAEFHHPDLAGIEPEETGDGEEVEVPVGGCKLEMIEAVYGGLEEGQDEHTVRPEQPDGDWTRMKERFAEETADAEVAFTDCLADRGQEGWEFYEGQILVHDYLVAAGEGVYALNSYPDAGVRWPDPPDDAPDGDDAQGWLDFERALAADFAECGDESGYREAAVHGWQQAQLRYYLDIETAVFAWHDEMRELIAKAQEVIGE
ncbi:hypothetical protein [Glycomyces terrestris]|uniref:Uncharacterized protein n=1 Tax=Glycomyces terrestris TaxID=2493553 RepID=A0A426V4W6_9ACTN|nr:hypothetical protein [Glycomyces terrestris]RRS01870.1 hypothetical protein EIW28_03755 [Glycomyces terrestris]